MCKRLGFDECAACLLPYNLFVLWISGCIGTKFGLYQDSVLAASSQLTAASDMQYVHVCISSSKQPLRLTDGTMSDLRTGHDVSSLLLWWWLLYAWFADTQG